VGTPAASDLQTRGIEVNPWPRDLRFTPALDYCFGLRGDLRSPLPAMLGALRSVAGEITGLHATFLRADGGGKAEVSPAKKMLGTARGAAIRLGPVWEELHLAEGIESALSITMAVRAPVWAVGSAAGFRSLEPPAEVRRIVFWPDRDDEGESLRAARVAGIRLAPAGVRSLFAQLPDGMDANDVLQEDR
jgi:putative DNA primase/helicase